jgi:hypothetical protein
MQNAKIEKECRAALREKYRILDIGDRAFQPAK